VIPASNQAFREKVYSFAERPPSRGANELTWGELRAVVSRQSPDLTETSGYPPAHFWLAARSALTATPLAMFVLMLAVIRNRLAESRTRAVVIGVVVLLLARDFLVAPDAIASMIQRGVPGRALAWMLNVAFVAAAGILEIRTAIRSSERPAD
jgi:hypothetical protein